MRNPDYDNPRYEDPDWETDMRYYVEQMVEQRVSDFEI
jgi:hypothetical protein